MKTPTTDPYLATALALDPHATFEGTRTFPDGTTCPFRARADLYVIQAAWSGGCDFEDLADGYGAGMGTNDDWSGIRDSSAPAVAAMYAKARRFLSRSTPPTPPATVPHATGCECDVCMPPCPDCGSKYTEQDQDGAWICLPCTDTTDLSPITAALSTARPETTTARIARLYDATCDAYSFDAYGERGWRSAVRMLIKHGLTDRQVEAVLRSKWTRWAGDAATKGKRYGRYNGRDLERFMDTAKACGWSDVAALTVEHFGSND